MDWMTVYMTAWVRLLLYLKREGKQSGKAKYVILTTYLQACWPPLLATMQQLLAGIPDK